MSSTRLPDTDRIAALLRQAAAEELMPRFRLSTSTEKADGSLVTEADLAVQRRLGDELATHWPRIGLLGEEMPRAEQQRLLDAGGEPFWCLDPLDGTTNFACGFPGFCISLALVRGGRVEQGWVLDPLRDECFSARRGAGAWLDGAPIAPFACGQRLADCIAVIDPKRLPSARIAALLAPGAFRSQRNLGAVALEWCWLAAGRFQLYLHGGQGLWDHAAGRLIAAEAGAASELYAQHGSRPRPALTLAKSVALGAANAPLLSAWRDFVGLPLEPG